MLVAVSQPYERARSRNDYLSGLFLALATGTLVAIVQEIPRRSGIRAFPVPVPATDPPPPTPWSAALP
jgi:hypothetical protein